MIKPAVTSLPPQPWMVVPLGSGMLCCSSFWVLCMLPYGTQACAGLAGIRQGKHAWGGKTGETEALLSKRLFASCFYQSSSIQL
jgi:hypothetical protein